MSAGSQVLGDEIGREPRERVAERVERTVFILDTRSSSRAPLGFSCGRRMLDPRVASVLREPLSLHFELARITAAPAPGSRSLARPRATLAEFQANPRREFAARP